MCLPKIRHSSFIIRHSLFVIVGEQKSIINIMKLSQEEKRIIKNLSSQLKEKFGAQQVILYGSAARESMNKSSDIDIMVVLLKVDWEIEKQISDLCFDIELEFNMRRTISVMCFAEDELTDSPLRASPFVLNIMREGKWI